jgi:response regulator of citrate/malate metabolism
MLATASQAIQATRPLKVAIVEDNATARANLRSHLIGLENFEIASYSNGNELRNGLRLANFDMVIMDFHLGQSKNGVEWINFLSDRKLFQASTGLAFITSDSLPQTIGQILDLHPDFILIKPYTIKSLHTNLKHYLSLRKEIMPVLSYMSQDKNDLALNILEDKINQNKNKRFNNDFYKIKGRLLLAQKRYEEAAQLYSGILAKSSNVLWAHWGLIKSEFFIGKWQKCESMLHHLISESLTKDKAFEWLASVSIGKKEYFHAESILDNVKDSDLSIQATRLKVLALNMQHKHDQAKQLLEKKIQSNLSVKDRMSEYSLELARFHIQMAESFVDKQAHDPQKCEEEKQYNLTSARKLIGKTHRPANDRQGDTQKDFLLALAHVIDGDNNKALKLIDQSGEDHKLSDAKADTMIDAVKVWFGVGQADKAKAILDECDNFLLNSDNHIDRSICAEQIEEVEESYALQKERALQSNERGMGLYLNKQHNEALQCFYKAYTMYPGIPAFALNLLQCLADLDQSEFQGLFAQSIFVDLQSVSLSDSNLERLQHIQEKFEF